MKQKKTQFVNLSEEDINEILDAAKIVKELEEISNGTEENTIGKLCCLFLVPLILDLFIYSMSLIIPTNEKLGVLSGILTIGWILSFLFMLSANKMKHDQALDFINEMTPFCKKNGTVCNKIACPFLNKDLGECHLGYEINTQADSSKKG